MRAGGGGGISLGTGLGAGAGADEIGKGTTCSCGTGLEGSFPSKVAILSFISANNPLSSVGGAGGVALTGKVIGLGFNSGARRGKALKLLGGGAASVAGEESAMCIGGIEGGVGTGGKGRGFLLPLSGGNSGNASRDALDVGAIKVVVLAGASSDFCAIGGFAGLTCVIGNCASEGGKDGGERGFSAFANFADGEGLDGGVNDATSSGTGGAKGLVVTGIVRVDGCSSTVSDSSSSDCFTIGCTFFLVCLGIGGGVGGSFFPITHGSGIASDALVLCGTRAGIGFAVFNAGDGLTDGAFTSFVAICTDTGGFITGLCRGSCFKVGGSSFVELPPNTLPNA